MRSSAPLQTEVVLGTTTRRESRRAAGAQEALALATRRPGRPGGFGTGVTGLNPANFGVTGRSLEIACVAIEFRSAAEEIRFEERMTDNVSVAFRPTNGMFDRRLALSAPAAGLHATETAYTCRPWSKAPPGKRPYG